jgi:hypothetical protein
MTDTGDHIDAAVAAWRSGQEPDPQPLVVTRPWHDPPGETRLSVVYRCAGDRDTPVMTAQVGRAEYPLDDPVRLEGVVIPKPWGRELWMTGMEARGESRVAGTGGSLDLSSYLALAPERICRHSPIVLLKFLEPRPEPILGELYLEVHAEKREVYVVTGVDRAAWPDGRGRIRYGVDQSRRARYGTDAAFRAAFLEAVEDYERIRRAIDRGETGLEAQERTALAATRPFIAERTLAVGDVISVPAWVPHSLQHGVQVVEFQTPTYERLIIASTQAVVTQEHWDSRHGIEHMSLDEPVPPPAEPIAPGIERIARFDDFAVWRADLPSGESFRLPEALPYAVALCVNGTVNLAGRGRTTTLAAGEAALIPANAIGRPITVAESGVSLYAGPGL